MKKGLLFILGMLMMVSTAEASDEVKLSNNKGYYNHYDSKPIKFIERGVKFYIFQNGEVDFNTHSRFKTQYYYRNGRRYKKRAQHRGVRIDRDYYGRVRRVGNVFINYNRYGKVSRVGSIFINYRDRRMTRVGGLRISYDHYGNVRYFGHVKPNYRNRFNDYYFDDYIYDYNDNFFFDDDFYDDYDDYGEDDDYYFYKSKGKKGLKKGHKKGKIIKRKKLKKDGDYDNDHKDRKRRK